MEILNPMGSATRSCFFNALKLRNTKATENRRRRDPGEIWTILLAMSVDRRDIILAKVTDQLKPSSKRMHRH